MNQDFGIRFLLLKMEMNTDLTINQLVIVGPCLGEMKTKRLNMKNKKSEIQVKMEDLVKDEFRFPEVKNGVILITVEEMARVFINLLSDFMEFKRSTLAPSRKEEV